MRSQGAKSGNKREWVNCFLEKVSVTRQAFVWLSSLESMSLQRWAVQKWAQSRSRAQILCIEKGVGRRERENKGRRSQSVVWRSLGEKTAPITVLFRARPLRPLTENYLMHCLIWSFCDPRSFQSGPEKWNQSTWTNGVSVIINKGSAFCL